MSAAEPATVTKPKHPLYALTTSELSRYRSELEHQISGVPESAPAAADLRRLLLDVIEEEADRVRLQRAI
jgi:hypothetical protein